MNEEHLYNENNISYNKYGNNGNNVPQNEEINSNQNQYQYQYNFPNPNQKIYTENNINNYNYVYNQEDQTITPIITIKDLQDNPKQKLLINSPYSL